MTPKDDDLWDGFFDINGDGETDLAEEFLAYEMFEALSEDEEDADILLPSFDIDNETDDEYSAHALSEVDSDDNDKNNDYSWRDYAEDGSEYDIYPEDYETEDDYLIDLEMAKEDADDGEDGEDII